MIIAGPSRIVMMASGTYAYADIELHEPLHLVGGNNAGKTTLIAALQFLYIDQASHMQFAFDLDKSRRYYFPATHSFILFECHTRAGVQVLGVRGLGPVQSFQYERFLYDGPYSRTHYFDDARRPRAWADVSAQLALHNFRRIEPKQMEAVLTGVERGIGTSLGIVPTKGRDGYDRFRKVFKNLLRLARIGQDELKKTLYEIYETEFRQGSIDLTVGYKSKFDEITFSRDQIRQLRRLEPTIRSALHAAEERARLRSSLPRVWKGVTRAYERETTSRLRQASTAEAGILTAEAEIGRREIEASGSDDEALLDAGTLAKAIGRLDALRKLKARFASFDRTRADAVLSGLDAEISAVEQRLSSGAGTNSVEVRARIVRAERELSRDRELVSAQDDLVLAHLRRHLGDDTIAGAFELLDRRLLGIPVSPTVGEPLVVFDAAAVADRLRALARRASDAFEDASVRLPSRALDPVSLDEFADLEAIRARIAEGEGRLRELAKLLEAVEEEDKVRTALSGLQSRRRAALRELLDHDEFLAEKRNEASLAEQAAALQTKIDGLRTTGRECRERVATLRAALIDLRADKAAAERSIAEMRRRMQELSAPPDEWADPAATAADGGFDDLVRLLGEQQAAEHSQSQAVVGCLESVHRDSYGAYAEADEAATLARLSDELDALTTRQTSLEELWRSLVVDLRHAFKSLAYDLETLKSRVADLNRTLGKVAVSNLAHVKLIVDSDVELGALVRQIQAHVDMPLFARGDADDALRRIGDLLQKHPAIDLLQLFHLHFEIKGADGETRIYEALDRIESNGTTMTIKVLVNLLLLHDILGKTEVRLPFFLDEVASLDPGNLRGIVEFAGTLGFVPILASPGASTAVNNLYFLKQVDGRIVLEPTSAAHVRLARDLAR